MAEPIRVIDNVAVVAAQDYISDIIEVNTGSSLLSLHLQWSGTPTGAFTLFQSNLPQPGLNKTKGWVPVPTSEVDFTGKDPVGSASASFVNISAVSGCRYLLVYTHATGTGVLDVFSATKGVP